MAGKAKCWKTTLTLHGLHKAMPPRCQYQQGTGRRWCMITMHGVRPSKKELQKPKPKEQPIPKSNEYTAMNVCSRIQIEQISSQSLHADAAEGNWQLVLANYPMKELVRKNVERFAMLMSYLKPRRPPMTIIWHSRVLVWRPYTCLCFVSLSTTSNKHVQFTYPCLNYSL